MKGDKQTHELLSQLRGFLQAKSPEYFIQKDFCDVFEKIKTFSLAERNLSPMLRARFDFVGNIQNADGIFDWLSMEEVARIDRFKESLDDRLEFWENSILHKYTLNQISLLGLNEEHDELYLVWSETQIEPKIICYCSSQESIYENLNEYLKEVVRSFSCVRTMAERPR